MTAHSSNATDISAFHLVYHIVYRMTDSGTKKTVRIRKWLMHGCLLAGGLAAGLLASEMMLALFLPHKITARPFFHIQNFFCQYHPLLGWTNKPNYSGVVTISKNSSFTVAHNSKGLRDRERDHEKKPGTRRILAFGDSFAWGFGVRDSEVFTRLIESLAPGFEAVNMGVSGYGTDQELLYYTDEGYKYKHDLVILAFYANDIEESSSSISYRYPKPFFIPDSVPLTVTNVPVPKTSETQRTLFDNPEDMYGKTKMFLRRNTHIYPFVAARLNAIPWMRRLFLKTGLAEDGKLSAGSGLPWYQAKDEEQKWQLFFRLVKEFRSIARENNAGFLLVNIPLKEAPPGNLTGYKRISADDVRMNDNLSRTLQKFTLQNDIPFIDLLGPVREGQSKGIRYYNPDDRDIHLNREGHRLLADAVYQWLSEHRWTAKTDGS